MKTWLSWVFYLLSVKLVDGLKEDTMSWEDYKNFVDLVDYLDE